jgi:hypothetical protein
MVIINDVSDSYQQTYVFAHIICNHPVYHTHSDTGNVTAEVLYSLTEKRTVELARSSLPCVLVHCSVSVTFIKKGS